jgi:hypothetical protein
MPAVADHDSADGAVAAQPTACADVKLAPQRALNAQRSVLHLGMPGIPARIGGERQ